MEIKLDGKYQTRKGQAVKLLMTDAGCPEYPVIGARESEPGVWLPETWTADGRQYFDDVGANDFDLVEVPEPANVGYANIYANGYVSNFYCSRRAADNGVVNYKDRLACKRVEWRPGEFDE